MGFANGGHALAELQPDRGRLLRPLFTFNAYRLMNFIRSSILFALLLVKAGARLLSGEAFAGYFPVSETPRRLSAWEKIIVFRWRVFRGEYAS